MKKLNFIKQIRRVDVQVSIFTAVIVIFSSLLVYTVHYKITYNNMIYSLSERVYSIYNYVEEVFDKTTFYDINSKEDKDTSSYINMKEILENIKKATDVMYLYTAKQNEKDEFVYIVDGLDMSAPDFRYPGDKIENEIYDDMEKALSGEIVLPKKIKSTEWGKIFITYFPIHNGKDVVGVLGIEFGAEHQYNTYMYLKIITPIIALFTCAISVAIAVVVFRRISNPLYQDMYNTDHLTQLKNRNSYDVDIKNISAVNTQKEIGIISIDLNNLKKVNDMLGHQAGDVYIQTAANAIISVCNRDEIPYRTGGDEFVVVVKNSSLESLKATSENITSAFDSYKFDLNMNGSLAAGYAMFDEEIDKDIYDTYRRADSNMYENKKKYHSIYA